MEQPDFFLLCSGPLSPFSINNEGFRKEKNRFGEVSLFARPLHRNENTAPEPLSALGVPSQGPAWFQLS